MPSDQSWSTVRSTPLVEGLHSRGISVRHLGVVRSHLPLGEQFKMQRRLCLTEMCARMVKNQTRQQLRTAAELFQLPSLEKDRRVVLDVLNITFACTEASLRFWTAVSGDVRPLDAGADSTTTLVPAKRALLDKFGCEALEAREVDPNYDLRAEIDASLLLERLQASMNIQLSARARDELRTAPAGESNQRDSAFELVDADLLSIGTKVKHLSLIHI